MSVKAPDRTARRSRAKAMVGSESPLAKKPEAPAHKRAADPERGRAAVAQGVIAEAAAQPTSAPGTRSPLQALIAEKAGDASALPRAIPGSEQHAEHPHDAWSAAIRARFHQSDAVRAGAKHFQQIFGEAVRHARDATPTTDVPAGVLEIMKEHPMPGARHFFTKELVDGKELYSFLALRHRPEREDYDVDLQLFSTEGRVVGTAASLAEEFYTAPAPKEPAAPRAPLASLLVDGGTSAPLPQAIAGTDPKGRHPEADPWRNAITRAFHQSDAVRATGKPFHEVFGDAVRKALSAPAADAVPASMLTLVARDPPPPGSTVHFGKEHVDGRDLYTYLRLTPEPQLNRIEVDLQLFSTDGRVVGTLASLQPDD